MINTHKAITPRYRLFCRITCPALILLGLFLLLISNRVSQFTCNRSDGNCAISHLGLLPDQPVSFNLKDVKSFELERKGSEGAGSGDGHYYFNLTFETTGNKLQLLYSQLVPYQVLKPHADQINLFLKNPTIPKITIQIPETRSLDRTGGIYFMVIGLFYTLINARAILPAYQAAKPQPVLPQVETVAASKGEPPLRPLAGSAALAPSKTVPIAAPLKNRTIWVPLRFWLCWTFVPPMLSAICVGILAALVPLPDRFYHLPYIRLLITAVILVANLCLYAAPLVYLGMQGWILDRFLGSGLGWGTWLLLSLLGAFFSAVFIFVSVIRAGDYLFPTPGEGWVSILGLIFGSIMGLAQLPILRQRIPHASWSVLSSALAGAAMFAAFSILVFNFPQAASLANGFDNSGFTSPLIPFMILCYSAVKGAALAWIIYAD